MIQFLPGEQVTAGHGQIRVRILCLPGWFLAVCQLLGLAGLSCPTLGGCPYVGQQTFPLGNHTKSGLLTLGLQCQPARGFSKGSAPLLKKSLAFPGTQPEQLSAS